MVVKRVADPVEFLAVAEPLLLADEARHNLMLGIAGSLRDEPGLYAEFRAWLVERDGQAVGVALQTPPHNLVLARPAAEGVVEFMAEALRTEQVELPGVTAALPEAEELMRVWTAQGGTRARTRMRQRIYRLVETLPVTGVPGRARHATAADRSLLYDWVEAFAVESVEDADRTTARRQVDHRLKSDTSGFALWEDGAGEAVSLVGWGGQTPNGVRVGPVYTPPEHRRRGYASALTANVSAELLAAGRRFCFLYTDLSNPTSNRIYMDVGYEPVCDSVDYAFERPLNEPR